MVQVEYVGPDNFLYLEGFSLLSNGQVLEVGDEQAQRLVTQAHFRLVPPEPPAAPVEVETASWTVTETPEAAQPPKKKQPVKSKPTTE